ncbi:MAG: alginate lyase family protein [Anaerolineales bacterium]|nr:alginate lyase family protein [Anaerolineales bacterium]
MRRIIDRVVRSFRKIRSDILGTTISDAAYARALIDPSDQRFLPGLSCLDSTPVFFIDTARKEEWARRIRQDYPDVIPDTIAAAERVSSHKFDLMGSGCRFLGDQINWHQDFKTGFTFRKQDYYAAIQPAACPGGYDIVLPWELSRCQHFVWMGQAYWFNGDQRCAVEFVNQVQDWIKENPPEYGVNWACTMDVAIRAVNWFWGYFFFEDSAALNNSFMQQFGKSLLTHGRFILKNLENRREIIGNHYLANLAGLLYLGILCPNFKEAAKWRAFCLKELEIQMTRQVHPDGTDFEDSTNYQRLVTEIYLSAVILARKNGYRFPETMMDRLERMIEVFMHLTRQDGTVPQVGDSDNGRLHRLKVWEIPDREWKDFRYLLAIGAVLFERRDFALAAGDQWEEAYWLLGKEAWDFRDALEADISSPDLSSILFPFVGWAVLRGTDSHVLVTAGPVGQNGKGGHSHNDELGFELFVSGQSWLVDTGTGCYTADYLVRNRLRSTASHNTIRVDGEEQHLFDPEEVFRLNPQGSTAIPGLKTGNGSETLSVENTAYARLDVSHTRKFELQSEPFELIVEDRLITTDLREFEAFLHPHPELEVLIEEQLIHLTNPSGKVLQIEWVVSGAARPARWTQEESLYSPSYGIVQENRALKLAWRAQGETMLKMTMTMAGS